MTQHLERLDGLAPMLRQPALELIQRCQQKLGRRLFIVHGWRSLPEQMAIYAKGRAYNRETQEWEIADAAAIVTKARPGSSAHNVITQAGQPASMALDVIPFAPDRSLDWEVDLGFWDDLYEIAWKVGLDPEGDQIGSYLAGDRGHFGEPGWKLKIEGLGLLLPSADLATGYPAPPRRDLGGSDHKPPDSRFATRQT